jgi:hypothetical protein
MLLRVLVDCCRSRQDVALENLVLRHQLEVLLRRKPKPRLRNRDRILLVWVRRLWPQGVDSPTEDRATGDGDRLASQGLAPVLELEVAQSARPATLEHRSQGTDCSNVAGKSSVGHRAHPR